MSNGSPSIDELQGMFHEFGITDSTASLLRGEGYTSIKLLKNLGKVGPNAVNEISGLSGAQRMAVTAMLMELVPGDTSSPPPPYSQTDKGKQSSQAPPFRYYVRCWFIVGPTS